MDELTEKTERLVRLANDEKLAGILINLQPNFAWLTSGGTSGVDESREAGAANLLVLRDGRRFVIASKIEIGRMLAEEVSADLFEPVEYRWQDEKERPDLVRTLAERIANGAVATDGEIDAKIAALRHCLTHDEAERFRGLCGDAAGALEKAARRALPGESELEVAETIRRELAAQGMKSVVTLVAADERIAAFRHPVPTKKNWTDRLMLVTCARRGGLTASLSRLISRGPVDDDLRMRTRSTAFVLASLVSATRPGATGSELYGVAAKAYQKCGFAAEIELHHQGGAAGYRTREWVAHPASSEVVKRGQAFAWNPSITGTKVEVSGIAQDDGLEVLTETGDWPGIETEIDGRTFKAADILEI